jgi:hypothetical protein
VAATAIVVLDSYADEIAELPLGMEFLQLVNGLTILAAVSGGLQFLTRAENLTKIKGSWAKVKNLLKAGTRAEIEAGFIAQLELAEQIAARSKALRTTEELTEFRKWLRQLEDEGKLTAELRGKAEVAAARYVEGVMEAEKVANSIRIQEAIKSGELVEFETQSLRICQTLETNAEMKVLKNLKKSVEADGFNYNIPFKDQIHVFNYNGVDYIVNGHHRLAVALKLSIGKIKGIYISEEYLKTRYWVTPEQLIKESEKAIQKGNKIRWY